MSAHETVGLASLYVGINVAFDPERTRLGWSVTTNEEYVHAQEADTTATLPALLTAFEHVLHAPDLSGRHLVIYCPDADFLDAVAPLDQAWPHVVFQPWSETLASGQLVRAARRAAAALFVVEDDTPAVVEVVPVLRKPKPALVVATDGSAKRTSTNNTAGFGWIAEDGRHGQGRINGSVLAAELAAIENLLAHLPAKRDLTVLVDSRSALNVVHQLQRGVAAPTGAKGVPENLLHGVAKGLVKYAHHTVQFKWVRAHSGHVLNEGADRLAVQARRGKSLRVPADVQAMTRERIVQETMEALRAGIVATDAS